MILLDQLYSLALRWQQCSQTLDPDRMFNSVVFTEPKIEYLGQLQTTKRLLLLEKVAQRRADSNVWRHWRETFHDSVSRTEKRRWIWWCRGNFFRADETNTHDIFSEGAGQGTSSSISSSLSSVAAWCPAARLMVDPENMSGTGKMLGLRSGNEIQRDSYTVIGRK